MQKKSLIARVKWFLFAFIAFIVLVPAITLGVLVAWISVEPREISEIKPKLEEVLNPEDGRFKITVGNVYLGFGEWNSPIEIRLVDVRLEDASNQPVATFPEIHIALNRAALLRGEVMLRSVKLIEPSMFITQDKDGTLFFGGTDSDVKPIPIRSIIMEQANDEGSETLEEGDDSQSVVDSGINKEEDEPEGSIFDSGLETLKVENANVYFISHMADISLDIPSANIEVSEDSGVYEGKIDFHTLKEAERGITLAALFSYVPVKDALEATMNIDSLRPSAFSEFGSAFEVLEQLDLPLSGSMRLSAHLPSQVDSLELALQGSEGKLNLTKSLGKVIPLKHSALEVVYENDALLIRKLDANIEGIELSASGDLQKNADIWNATMHAQLKNATSKLIDKYWPKEAAVNARDWVTTSVVGAHVPVADISVQTVVNVAEGVEFGETSVDAKVQVAGAEVIYDPKKPSLKGVNGSVHILNDSLSAVVESATMFKKTKLYKNGSVSIPSFNAKDMEINIHVPLQSTASEVVQYLHYTPYGVPEMVKLDAKTIAGSVKGELDVLVIDHTKPKPDAVSFAIAAEIEGVGQDAIVENINVANLSGAVKATDQTVDFKGAGLINGEKVSIDAVVAEDGSAHYKGEATLPVTLLAGTGVEEVVSDLVGESKLKLDWKQQASSSGREIKLSGDLANIGFALPKLNIQKVKGKASSFNADIDWGEGTLTLKDFLLEVAEDGVAKGAGTFNIQEGAVSALTLDEFSLGRHQFLAEYKAIEDGHFLRLSGQTIDLSGLGEQEEDVVDPQMQDGKMQDGKDKQESSSFDWQTFKIPTLDVRSKVENVYLPKGRELTYLAVSLDCKAGFCEKVDATAIAGETPFYAVIAKEGKNRILKVTSPDAGKFLQEIDLFDDMKGGQLRLTGVFQDHLPGRPLIGKLTISEHRVKNVPILARLLTVATFTGILDAMSGEGLMFQQLEAPFKFEDFNVTLKGAKTIGPSIGITADGPIYLADNRIDVRGTIIPAYMFNNILGQLPLLGDVYGQIAGEGLVAMNYTIKGNNDKTKVSVNPLSALTPGFLRGFFDIFDPVESEDAKEAATAAKALKELNEEIEALEKELPNFNPPKAK